MVKANDTTRELIKGLAVAAALSVLQSDNIKHGAILKRSLPSVRKRVLNGAFGLQKDMRKGKSS
jgi:hypothetical protein